MNTKLEVITKCVSIEEEEFVLVKITKIDNQQQFFGTIPFAELDEKGCMKRRLNGLEMCLTDTIAQALDMRKDEIITRNMSMTDVIAYYTQKLQHC